jgi:predicted ATP-dependent endonuclease of OLD family
MLLITFEYTANQGLPNEWRIEKCQFGHCNLIVGKNASGKSTLLQAISKLADLFKTNEITALQNEEWHVLFDTDKPNYQLEYLIKIQKGLVVKEQLIEHRNKNKSILLDRFQLEENNIWTEDVQKQIVKSQTQKAKIAIAQCRDYIGYLFSEYFYLWSSRISFYNFGTDSNKSVISFVSNDPALNISKTVVVDDFGCRLDYESSPIIAKYLVEYSNRSPTQFILTTNNQFVVNSVPLDCLSVIERTSNVIKLHNIFNSQEKFEEFKFIGLNNFDLFTSDFLL